MRFLKQIKQALMERRSVRPEDIRTMIRAGDLAGAEAAIPALPANLPHRDVVTDCLLGLIRFHQRDDDAARELFIKVLRVHPEVPEAHHGLSIVLAEGGQILPATKHAQFAVNAAPEEARFQAQAGYCNLVLNNLQAALPALQRATRLDPDDAHAWNNLGVLLTRKGDPARAARAFQRALDIKPDFVAARHHAERLAQDFSAAARIPGQDTPVRDVEELEQILIQSPDNFDVVEELNRAYCLMGDPQSGIDVLTAWRVRHPGDVRASKALGLAQLGVSAFAEAADVLLVALNQGEPDPEVFKALGSALSRMDRFDEAGRHFESAAKLSPSDDDLKMLQATNLMMLCRYEEALRLCEDLTARGIVVPVHGCVLSYMGRIEEGQAMLDRYLTVQPHEPNLRLFRSSLRLLREQYAQGWEDYRYRTIADRKENRVVPLPEWDGEPLEGKQIVVLAEQGLGDQVMFASCLNDLAALGPSKIVVEVIVRAAETLARSFPQFTIVPTKQNLDIRWLNDFPDLDYFVHLADLPLHFRRSAVDFPLHEGYLVPDDGKVARWRSEISGWAALREPMAGRRPRIGLSWRGGLPSTRQPVRTIPLEDLAALCRGIDATWVGLQYGNAGADVERLQELGVDMAYWPESIADLDDFAAIVSGLDLVITVCNTTVHYAGALGRCVWVLAPMIPEWRYGLDSPDMPWYPSARVFRQPCLGDWRGLIETVRNELRAQAFDQR